MVKAWLPYVIVALLLLTSRVVEPFRAILQSLTLNWSNILGTGINMNAVQPLYLPGTLFIIASLITVGLHQIPGAAYGKAWSGARQVWWRGATEGDQVALSFSLEEAGLRRVKVAMTRAPDYGIVKFFLGL